jgi:hypothetical protein
MALMVFLVRSMQVVQSPGGFAYNDEALALVLVDTMNAIPTPTSRNAKDIIVLYFIVNIAKLNGIEVNAMTLSQNWEGGSKYRRSELQQGKEALKTMKERDLRNVDERDMEIAESVQV